MKIYNNPKWKEDYEEDLLLLEEQIHQIILHNDEFNTFDYVIDCLMEICEHSEEQAEQCAHLVHYKGKCDVKRGTMEDLIPRHHKLLDKGLSTEIV